jgi:hypothetical protein
MKMLFIAPYPVPALPEPPFPCLGKGITSKIQYKNMKQCNAIQINEISIIKKIIYASTPLSTSPCLPPTSPPAPLRIGEGRKTRGKVSNGSETDRGIRL